LLVSFSKAISYFTLIKAENEFSEVLNKKVDLVTKAALHKKILPYVEKDKKLIYEK